MVVVLSIIAITFMLLYMNTDMFKSKSTLFTKYIGQNMENMESVYRKIGVSKYNEVSQQNKHTEEMQIKVNYTENIGTSSEATENSINQLKLKINGQVDNSNQYHYQNINLLKNEEKIARIESIQNENTYGIRFSDLFNQYILANNENLKELFAKMSDSEQPLVKLPNSIELKDDFKDVFQLLEEEKQNMKTKYISIIKSSISEDNVSKQKNQTIQVNGKSIEVNSYMLTITVEQLNNIYIKMLEEIKQDEIFLARIDKIQTIIEKYQATETINLREQFTTKIEDLITDITRNNIEQDEIKIMVYENNQRTVRTLIQHLDYTITIDFLSYETEDYMQLVYQNAKNEEEREVTCQKTKEETNIVFNHTKDGVTTQYSFIVNEKIDTNHCIRNTVAKYEDEINRVEATIQQEINTVDNFENQIVLNHENSINLSELEAEQVQVILDKVKSNVSKEINEITTTDIKIEDLRKVLKTVKILKERQNLESMGITETEKNRFNSQFEILQGEKLDSSTILNLITAIQENLIDLEIVSNRELKLKLDRLNKNEELATTLSSFIEENKNMIYNAKVEYDEETGLVSDILLTMLEK